MSDPGHESKSGKEEGERERENRIEKVLDQGKKHSKIDFIYFFVKSFFLPAMSET